MHQITILSLSVAAFLAIPGYAQGQTSGKRVTATVTDNKGKQWKLEEAWFYGNVQSEDKNVTLRLESLRSMAISQVTGGDQFGRNKNYIFRVQTDDGKAMMVNLRGDSRIQGKSSLGQLQLSAKQIRNATFEVSESPSSRCPRCRRPWDSKWSFCPFDGARKGGTGQCSRCKRKFTDKAYRFCPYDGTRLPR